MPVGNPNWQLPDHKGGNPVGRPGGAKGSVSLAKKVRQLIGEDGERMVKVLIDIAEYGESESARAAAANTLLDRAFGKAIQPVEEVEGGPRVLNLVGMAPEEMEQLHALLGKAVSSSKEQQKLLEEKSSPATTESEKGTGNGIDSKQQEGEVESES